MDSNPAVEIVSSAPAIGVISMVLMWTFFLIALSLVLGFLRQGLNAAIAEFLISHCNDEQREKYIRWFANHDRVLEEIKQINTALKKGKKSS